MYVYRNTGTNPSRPYEVGYYAPAGAETSQGIGPVFLVASRHATAVGARRRVNYLNGGPVPVNTGDNS